MKTNQALKVTQELENQMQAKENAVDEIDELKRQVEFWKNRAERDGLTGLLRREAFKELASERVKFGWISSPVTLALIDADHFKKVNDTYGHLVGDKVLQLIGKVLSECIPAGAFAGRIGGEEFALLIPATGEKARKALDKVRALLSCQRLKIDLKTEIQFTVSAGMSTWNVEKESFEMAAAKADLKLYLAKAQGRNRIAA